MAPALRPPSPRVLLAVALSLLSRSTQAQQLGSTFALEDQQTAVARVAPGQFVRVRLKDGTRAGGPLVRATPLAFTVGPSVAFSDRDSVLHLWAVDSMWVRAYSTRKGTVTGGVLGAFVGLGIGSTTTSLCPGAKACARGVVTTAASAALFGGLIGSLVGSERTHWRRLLPHRYGRQVPADLAVATLSAPPDSTAFDPRALALMRLAQGSQVRLTFADRGDLAGYVLRSGARGATLAVLVGHADEAPIPIASLEGIWERGTARQSGSTAGLLLGTLAGVIVATNSSGCEAHRSCRSTIIADGGALGLLGFFLGDRVGRIFPQWHRRY